MGVLGQPRQFTRIREDFLEAFYHEKMGGVDGLLDWVLSDPKNQETFYRMIVQLLPKELNLSGREGGPIELTDPERVTKLQYVMATLERAVKQKTETLMTVTPEPPLIDVPKDDTQYESRPSKDRISNLINFVKRIEGVKVA